MPFRTRNPYYLRISKKNVLPLYLYLDERHVHWMSDFILQHVLTDLRPHVLSKLQTEIDLSSSAKKGDVETHRGENYQFCYFLRKTEPHSLVLKTRNFVTRRSDVELAFKSLNTQKKKRKDDTDMGKPSKKRRTKVGRRITQDEDDYAPSGVDTSSDEELLHDISGHESRKRKGASTPGATHSLSGSDGATAEVSAYRLAGGSAPELDKPHDDAEQMDVDAADSNGAGPHSLVIGRDIDDSEEEEKPKPVLQLNYQGFNISNYCLCIVVEPWPPMHARDTARSSMSATAGREQTPLFLPDEPITRPDLRFRTPLHLETEDSLYNSDHSDEGGMMQLTQVLRATGDHKTGAVNDDEEIGGEYLFGDADEVREL